MAQASTAPSFYGDHGLVHGLCANHLHKALTERFGLSVRVTTHTVEHGPEDAEIIASVHEELGLTMMRESVTLAGVTERARVCVALLGSDGLQAILDTQPARPARLWVTKAKAA